MIEWFVAGCAFGAFLVALVVWLQAAMKDWNDDET